MIGKTSIKYLQEYIKQKDYNPKRVKDYFLKLTEEVGELAKVVRKGILKKETGLVKGTIDEELWDVIYYAIAIANCYDINLEDIIKEKEEINKEKYGYTLSFEENK